MIGLSMVIWNVKLPMLALSDVQNKYNCEQKKKVTGLSCDSVKHCIR